MIVKELEPPVDGNALVHTGRLAEEQMAFYLRRAFAEDAQVCVFHGRAMLGLYQVEQEGRFVVGVGAPRRTVVRAKHPGVVKERCAIGLPPLLVVPGPVRCGHELQGHAFRHLCQSSHGVHHGGGTG